MTARAESHGKICPASCRWVLSRVISMMRQRFSSFASAVRPVPPSPRGEAEAGLRHPFVAAFSLFAHADQLHQRLRMVYLADQFSAQVIVHVGAKRAMPATPCSRITVAFQMLPW